MLYTQEVVDHAMLNTYAFVTCEKKREIRWSKLILEHETNAESATNKKNFNIFLL